eukprot:749267-Hanusia_phi.AAC.2
MKGGKLSVVEEEGSRGCWKEGDGEAGRKEVRSWGKQQERGERESKDRIKREQGAEERRGEWRRRWRLRRAGVVAGTGGYPDVQAWEERRVKDLMGGEGNEFVA